MSMALGRRTSTAAASETSMTQGSRYTTAVGRGSSMVLRSKPEALVNGEDEVLGICEDDKLGSSEAQCRRKSCLHLEGFSEGGSKSSSGRELDGFLLVN